MKSSWEDSFDKFIRNSVEDYKAPFDEYSWDKLVDKMDGTAQPDDVSSVDILAKANLGNLQVPYEESSWTKLQQRISDLEAENVEKLDRAAQDAMKNLWVPYDHSTWHILSDRLERMDYDRKVKALKVLEAAVVVLAILTLVRFIGHMPEAAVDNSSYVSVEQSAENSNGQSQLGVVKKEAIESSENSESFKQSDEDIANALTSNTSDQSDAVDITSQVNPASIKRSSGIDQLNEREIYVMSVAQPLNRAGIDRGDMAAIDALSERTWLLDEKKPVELGTTPGQLKGDMIEAVPTLSYTDLIMTSDRVVDKSFAPITVEKVPKVTTKLGIYQSFNRHSIENYRSWASSFVKQTTHSKSFGLAAVVSFGRMAFDVGLAYDKLKYEAEFDHSEIHKVELPVHLRYSVVSNDFSNIYLKGGASYHGVMAANYVAPTSTASPGPSGGNREKYNDGLLHDGYREYNTYMQWHAGFGVEIFATKKFSLFAESLLQKHFSGELGQTRDRISTISNKIGLNYRL